METAFPFDICADIYQFVIKLVQSEQRFIKILDHLKYI